MAPMTALTFMLFLFGMTYALQVVPQDVYNEIRYKLDDLGYYVIFRLDGNYVSVVEEGNGYEQFRNKLFGSNDLRYGYYFDNFGEFCDRNVLIFRDTEDAPLMDRMNYMSNMDWLSQDLKVKTKSVIETNDLERSRLDRLMKKHC